MTITPQNVFEYHRRGRPGKIEVTATKPLSTQRNLSLAYSPGVAEAVLEVARNPLAAYELTAKANLVAVISNGTAILGLGNKGPLAAKPVMEGKGVLFKRFADIDVFDIEINAKTVEEMVTVVRALAPTFGGINLEDIKAPECFDVERILQGGTRHPGIPRRPARHGDHFRRRAAECGENHRQEAGRDARRGVGRRRTAPSPAPISTSNSASSTKTSSSSIPRA